MHCDGRRALLAWSPCVLCTTSSASFLRKRVLSCSRRQVGRRRPRTRCSVEHSQARAEPNARTVEHNGATEVEASTKDFVILENITLSFGKKRVFHKLNLKLRAGEGTAIIGTSGTGKSTTLRLICGLQMADEGRVVINGWERKRSIREDFGPVKVAMVFQQAALLDALTVRQNVGFELFNHSNLKHERIVQLVDAALLRVGLSGIADLYPSQLSGGMRKRVSFARATLYDPEDRSTAPQLVLYDEPSAGLDPPSSTRIENCIRDLQTVCSTYVVVTHQLSTIRRTADRVVFLHQGQVQWDGPIADIDTTTNPFIRQFLSASLDGPLDDNNVGE